MTLYALWYKYIITHHQHITKYNLVNKYLYDCKSSCYFDVTKLFIMFILCVCVCGSFPGKLIGVCYLVIYLNFAACLNPLGIYLCLLFFYHESHLLNCFNLIPVAVWKLLCLKMGSPLGLFTQLL